jgi:hypothetical protein
MNMNNASRKIELLAHIIIITTSLLLSIAIVKTYLLPSAPRPAALHALSPGTKLSLSRIDWSGAHQTILVVLAKGCNYCSESAPFYQRLALKASSNKSVRLIAVLLQEPEEARQYLDSLHVPIGDVVQAELGSIRVEGTPTLILVDSTGVVKETWVGKLPTEAESEVLSKL